MAEEERLYEPPALTRAKHNVIMGTVGFLCRSFLYGLNRTEVHGLEHFQALVDERSDPRNRERGLITVSNHVSIIDDPIAWGVLPFRYHWDANNSRYSLGSHDICFKQGRSPLNTFFTYGNTLPMHRIAHSKYGGIFQPTMTQVIRLLSDPHASPSTSQPEDHLTHPPLPPHQESSLPVPSSLPPSDPFSASALTYTTNGLDSYPSPSYYPSRRHSWVHVFPEGKIHQHPDRIMRYFKWGVARMILESEPCPDVLTMWIDGPQHMMPNERGFPRPLPRPGKDVSITFGEKMDVGRVFGPYRRRWRELVRRAEERQRADESSGTVSGVCPSLGELHDHDLRYGAEAEQLRKDVTLAVREEVLRVRRSTGLPDEDPKCSLVDTWRNEETGVWDWRGNYTPNPKPKKEGRMADGSSVGDM